MFAWSELLLPPHLHPFHITTLFAHHILLFHQYYSSSTVPKEGDSNRAYKARLFIICSPRALATPILEDAFCRFGALIDVYTLPGKTIGYAKFDSRQSAEDCRHTLNGAEVAGCRLKVCQSASPENKCRGMFTWTTGFAGGKPHSIGPCERSPALPFAHISIWTSLSIACAESSCTCRELITLFYLLRFRLSRRRKKEMEVQMPNVAKHNWSRLHESSPSLNFSTLSSWCVPLYDFVFLGKT